MYFLFVIKNFICWTCQKFTKFSVSLVFHRCVFEAFPFFSSTILFFFFAEAFTATWQKYYCTYKKQNKQFTMLQYNQQIPGRIVSLPKSTFSFSFSQLFDFSAIDARQVDPRKLHPLHLRLREALLFRLDLRPATQYRLHIPGAVRKRPQIVARRDGRQRAGLSDAGQEQHSTGRRIQHQRRRLRVREKVHRVPRDARTRRRRTVPRERRRHQNQQSSADGSWRETAGSRAAGVFQWRGAYGRSRKQNYRQRTETVSAQAEGTDHDLPLLQRLSRRSQTGTASAADQRRARAHSSTAKAAPRHARHHRKAFEERRGEKSQEQNVYLQSRRCFRWEFFLKFLIVLIRITLNFYSQYLILKFCLKFFISFVKVLIFIASKPQDTKCYKCSRQCHRKI